ncbi:FliH/SctL family protein [Ruminiclostridium papyrosolvens]|uniref:Flagellar assembly protein FliH n=1 Tax=Ruminiclostridium papyrosolvens C7 TaxID=1330534 RepID=U4R4V3_9FIRM|nr:FliH/SctL family protein [Ruminiclostridium papyrosolvens]EPR13075.1 flagellar assembly protein FliH [Ruminiclostridium papyrosolvens C7]
MSNKIYKNNQVNVGIPFQVKFPVTYQPPVRNIGLKLDLDQDDEDDQQQVDYIAMGEGIINKAKAEADMIIKEALLEAKDIIKNASVDVENLKQQVYEEARSEGYEQGLAQAKQEYEALIKEAQDIKTQAGIEYKQVLDSLEEDSVNTILDIAKKVISKELECKQNILLLVKDAFEKCSKDRKAILKLSEQDFDFVNENKYELESMLERSEEIEIKKDLSLKEGGCIIETSFGSIDASAATKIEKIENDFKDILNESTN